MTALGGPHPLGRAEERGIWSLCMTQLKVILSMVREPHNDKNLNSKITKSKILLGFPNVPFNAVVFGGLDFLGYLKGSSSSGLEEITCRGQKKQTLKNLFSFGNKSLIVALAFSLLISFMQ
jgi:hypothetical protein